MDFDAASRLVRKHREAGILVDAQLLLLLLVGSYDRHQIGRFSRTASTFDETDCAIICELLRDRVRILVTPHILTEVDDLADAPEFRCWLRDMVLPHLHERSPSARKLAALPEFPRLGFADCSAMPLARQQRLVLTCDFDLYRQLSEERLPVINFTHLRASVHGWNKALQALFPSHRTR